MARPNDPTRGRQPGSPPPSEIARSKARLTLSEAGQRDAAGRDRRILDESRRLKSTFEELRGAIQKLQDDAESRRKVGKKVAESFEKVLKFYSQHEVQQALPAESTRVIKTARDLRGHVDMAHPSVAPVEAMLVSLAFVAAIMKRKFFARATAP